MCPSERTYAYLVWRIARVPQGVSEELPRAGTRLDGLQLYARLGGRPEGSRLPVCLSRLLPHNDVEAAAVLVAEHEAGVVVVRVGVDEERAAEIDATELSVTCGKKNTAVQ